MDASDDAGRGLERGGGGGGGCQAYFVLGRLVNKLSICVHVNVCVHACACLCVWVCACVAVCGRRRWMMPFKLISVAHSLATLTCGLMRCLGRPQPATCRCCNLHLQLESCLHLSFLALPHAYFNWINMQRQLQKKQKNQTTTLRRIRAKGEERRERGELRLTGQLPQKTNNNKSWCQLNGNFN